MKYKDTRNRNVETTAEDLLIIEATKLPCSETDAMIMEEEIQQMMYKLHNKWNRRFGRFLKRKIKFVSNVYNRCKRI